MSLLSCAFGDGEDVVPAVTFDDRVIYVAGRYNTHACLWVVNGSSSARFMLQELPGTTSSWGRGIALYGDSVIVTGCCYNGATYYPVMWVNGAPVSLTPAGYTTFMYNGEGIAVRDGHVFITATSGNFACLWIDGVLQQLSLPAGATASSATSIAIELPHVLVGGSVTIGGFIHACTWIDGQCAVLNMDSSTSLVNGVALYAGHVYATGQTTGTYNALWVDGAYNPIQTGTPSFAYGIAMLDGMPIITGQLSTSLACNWLHDEGMRQVLTSAVSSTGNGIYVYTGGMRGTTVLVAGRANDSGTMGAYLWIDGSPVQLDRAGTLEETDARAVAVGPKNW